MAGVWYVQRTVMGLLGRVFLMLPLIAVIRIGESAEAAYDWLDESLPGLTGKRRKRMERAHD